MYIFFHARQQGVPHVCHPLNEKPSPFVGFEPSFKLLCLFVLRSCTGRSSKQMVLTHLLYATRDYIDLLHAPKMFLFQNEVTAFWLTLLTFNETYLSFCSWGYQNWAHFSRHVHTAAWYFLFCSLFPLLIIPNICFALLPATELWADVFYGPIHHSK